MNFKEWNDAIAKNFFRRDKSGERVYLYVSSDTIEEIGVKGGVKKGKCVDSFVKATKEGHWFAAKDGISVAEASVMWVGARRHLWAEEKEDDYPFPPYIAYLALFVLAASYDPNEEFETQAYYPRLNKLLGRNSDAGRPKGFEETKKVWKDLEKWANIEKKGRLGLFEVHRLDKRTNVGIPRSQTVLTHRERQVAKWVFAQSGFDPALPPSEEEIATRVWKRGRDHLRSQTVDLLRRKDGHPHYHRELQDALLDVFNNWDGSPVEIQEVDEDSQSRQSYRGTLALSLTLSFGEAEFYLRCISRRDYPDGGIVLREGEEGNEYSCHEIVNGWSSALQDESGQRVDATRFNWSEEIAFSDPDLDWEFVMEPTPVRVFVSGQEAGVPNVNLVEMRRLPLGVPFYLLARSEESGQIEGWGSSSCEGFGREEVLGVPDGWHLYSADAAHNDEGVHGTYEVLTQPRSVSLKLVGGVRVRPRANEYFTFAPPSIQVRGKEKVRVWCNETPIESDSGEVYRLPRKFRSPGEVEITATAEGKEDVLGRKLFVLYNQAGWKDISAPGIDEFGNVNPGQESRMGVGSAEEDTEEEKVSFNLFPRLLSMEAPSIYLVGALPGQVVRWPEEALPEDWQAVWAVPKNGKVIYCWPGTSAPAPKPPPDVHKPGGSDYSESDVKEWRKVLYVWRRRISGPDDHSDLWKDYQNHAEKC